MTRKGSNLIVSILTILLIASLVFGVVWAVNNANKLKQAVDGTNLYTQSDLEKAKQEGYDEALQNEQDYLNVIASLRDDKTTLTDALSQANSRISTLTQENTEKQTIITNLRSVVASNEQTITNLQNTISQNDSVIDLLNADKTLLQNQLNEANADVVTLQGRIVLLNDNITALNTQNTNLRQQITTLESQVSSLNYNITTLQSTITRNNAQITALTDLVNSLQDENDDNVITIARLNDRISLLQSQIAILNVNAINNNNNYDSLNATINDLQSVIAYYQSFIDLIKPNNTYIATFMYDNSVYNMQVVQPNTTVSVTAPTSTSYKVFNYWTVNDVQVNLATYTISQNTEFVANITYYYDAIFKVDNNVYDSQLIVKNGLVTIPTNPTKNGYTFNGWLLNGVPVDLTSYTINQNTEFVADFIQQHTVIFKSATNTNLSTELVENNNYIVNIPANPTKTGHTFNGWSIDGTNIVDIVTYRVIADVTFIPLFTINSYTVTFKQDNTVLGTKTVDYGNLIGIVSYSPTVPTNYEFIHWYTGWNPDTSGIDLSTYRVTSNVTLNAYVKQVIFNVSFYGPNGTLIEVISTDRNTGKLPRLATPTTVSGYNFVGWVRYLYNSVSTTQTILNRTFTFNDSYSAYYASTLAGRWYNQNEGYFFINSTNKIMLDTESGSILGSPVATYLSCFVNEIISGSSWSSVYEEFNSNNTLYKRSTFTYNANDNTFTLSVYYASYNITTTSVFNFVDTYGVSGTNTI